MYRDEYSRLLGCWPQMAWRASPRLAHRCRQSSWLEVSISGSGSACPSGRSSWNRRQRRLCRTCRWWGRWSRRRRHRRRTVWCRFPNERSGHLRLQREIADVIVTVSWPICKRCRVVLSTFYCRVQIYRYRSSTHLYVHMDTREGCSLGLHMLPYRTHYY